MQEIELKFLVPQARLKSLLQQTKIKSSQTVSLSAHYFDTPNQELSRRGIGLRIRHEGDKWVQTIKAGGDGIAARLEHNTLLDNSQVQTMIDRHHLLPDLSLYENTEIAPYLADINLKKLAKNLVRQYVTDVERITRLLKSSKNANSIDDSKNDCQSIIEVAYDNGKIIHGKDDALSHGIQEIEFELISGQVDFLFATAKVWCKRYKLCLSTVTKAERGGLLVSGQAHSPAVNTQIAQLTLDQDSSMPCFIRTLTHNCLLQILPNSSAIVDGSQNAEHIVQLTIGIQRLLVALQTFKDFSAQFSSEWLPILEQTADMLNDYHKAYNLTSKVEPLLQSNGAPSVDWIQESARATIKPIDIVSANDFQLTLLELIAFTMSDDEQESKSSELAVNMLTGLLREQHKHLIKARIDVSTLIDSYPNGNVIKTSSPLYEAERHLLHDIIKMRHISEFISSFYDSKKHKRWLKRLCKTQKAIETHLDYQQYYECYSNKVKTNHDALFGAGWFAGQLHSNERRYKKHLQKLLKLKRFW